MSLPSFYEWLGNRAQEVPDTGRLALVIAQSGGMTREGLAKVVRLPPETLDDLLRALVAAGQVVMLKVGGEMVYRAAG